MNCCDYNCNRGRDCPARVAKVKSVTPMAQPLPPSPWRRHLRELAKWMLVVVAVRMLTTIGALLGCAQQPVETCGTLPDGSEFCTLLKATK